MTSSARKPIESRYTPGVIPLARCATCRSSSFVSETWVRIGTPRSPLHELARHVLRFSREDVVMQPIHEIAVVRDAPEERHRDVRVSVDEAGQNSRPG